MASEVSRGVASAVQWAIVGLAIGVLPTYVLMSERAKKESETASAAAASAAAASVYAAWNAAPKVSCPAAPITIPTVEALTARSGGGTPRVAHANPTPHVAGAKDEGGGDENEAQMMMPMLNMMQGMMNDNGGGSPAGSGMPDMTELMKNMPKK
jgi:hypothetical protein